MSQNGMYVCLVCIIWERYCDRIMCDRNMFSYRKDRDVNQHISAQGCANLKFRKH